MSRLPAIHATVDLDTLAVDGLEVVTLTTRRADGVKTTLIETAVREILNLREPIVAEGYFQADDLIWHLPAREVPDGCEPQPGDGITDSGNVEYEIREGVTLDPSSVDWACPSTKAR